MSNACDLFEPRLNQEDLLAAHLPEGGVFDAARKGDTNFRKLLIGLGVELYRLDVALYLVCNELDPFTTTDLLPEWERSVGIPDLCLKNTGSLEQRRQQVLLKLRGFRVQTAQDFIDLAAIFGETVQIEPGSVRGVYPMVYPVVYYPTGKAARFTMIVHFPLIVPDAYPFRYPFPYRFGRNGVIECLFRKIRPANVDIKFSYGTTAP